MKVKELQTALGIKADGIIGPVTTAEILKAAHDGRLSVVADDDGTVLLDGLNSRSMKNLQGVHADLSRVVIRASQISPVKFTVIEGRRTIERQRQLVASGASQTMNSRHITGHAVDLAPHDEDGDISFAWPLYYRLAPAMKQAAYDLGVSITWGGDWVSFKDGPHFELSRTAYPA